MKRIVIAAAALVTGALLACGCSSSPHNSGTTASPAVSAAVQTADGGDTTCKDFIAAAKTRKETIIENYLRSTGQSTNRTSITATRLSAEAFCRTSGKNKLVRDITTG
ncbi:hypothetical protein [Nocardia sp. NBC_01388]|uniref:hypothetical protein n=1 Tax=Nocardia sp. NBC_01388 TaxID=2903596 RepID=UPI0032504C47